MLFKTLPEIQELIAVGNGNSIEQLKPHILNAETAYIQPLLGASLFGQLQQFYNSRPVTSGSSDFNVEQMEALLLKIQKSLIHLAYWMGFQVLNTTISSQGFKRTESATTKSLFHYQEDELKEYFKTAGFNAMDEALEYLETKIVYFDDFDTTPTYTLIKSAFIPSTKIFNAIIDINSSRLTFLRLKSYSELVEDMEIRPILGVTIFDDIKAEMIKDEPAAKVLAILPYIRKPIAYLATALLMEESGADLSEKGLYFESSSATNISGRNKQPSSDERIAILVARYRGIGMAYLDQLKSYLAANGTDWPLYSGQTGSVIRRDNTDKKTFWNPVR